jgi:hypothetical protein
LRLQFFIDCQLKAGAGVLSVSRNPWDHASDHRVWARPVITERFDGEIMPAADQVAALGGDVVHDIDLYQLSCASSSLSHLDWTRPTFARWSRFV